MTEFGLYVHWPYCARKCPYCDFNSHVRAVIDETAWLDALLLELAWLKEFLDDRPTVSSVFFGGGTPSLMSSHALGRVLDRIAGQWSVANDVEITLEANPASAEAARFAGYRVAGVNRLSLGVQALNDTDLKFLGRLHTAEEAKSALGFAMRTFERVSIDLIYARPYQTIPAWCAELEEALSFGTGHISLYQLTIEPATPFAALHRSGALVVPDEETAATLYEVTQELSERVGLPAYEISNHARPGEESRHNLIYWRYGSYAGVGPGAHGRVARNRAVVATANEKLPERWHDRVLKLGNGIVEQTALRKEEAAREHLLMALRLREGVDIERYATRWGISLDARKIAELEAAGLVSRCGSVVAATARGRLVLNSIIAALAG